VAVAAPLDVPEQAGEVRALQLLKLHSAQDLRLWNELMCEHPQGAGVMVGAQLRYLIGSEHGWLGGLGFGASAIKLCDRDQWTGWDVRQQREHMHRVIGMSRFLIRPSVRCLHLQSTFVVTTEGLPLGSRAPPAGATGRSSRRRSSEKSPPSPTPNPPEIRFSWNGVQKK